MADYLIERGADAVLGGHSHVPQPMEYRTVTDVDGNEATGFVCYSLGNLISDMSKDNTYITAVLNLEVTKTEEGAAITGVSYEPLYLLNPSHDEIDTLVLMDVPAVLEAYEAGEKNPYLTEELCTELRASMTTLREIFGDEWPVSSEQRPVPRPVRAAAFQTDNSQRLTGSEERAADGMPPAALLRFGDGLPATARRRRVLLLIKFPNKLNLPLQSSSFNGKITLR